MAQKNSRRPKMTKNDTKKLSVTDRRTDRPTDRRTDRAGCRVACTRLKRSEWWNLVECATLSLNTKMLLESCKDKGKTRSKTLPITQLLEQDSYQLDYSHNVLFELPRKTVKMIIMARYRILYCAQNFKGKYGTEYCKECNVVDDESHRLNSCVKWKHVNLYNGGYSIDFNAVFSEDISTLRLMSRLLRSVWNLENGKNETRLINTA